MLNLAQIALANLAAPLVLLMPALGAGAQPGEMVPGDEAGVPGTLPSSADGRQSTAIPGVGAPDYELPPEGPYSPAAAPSEQDAQPLTAFYEGQVLLQVRIEQQIIFRISPRRRSNRNSLLARLPSQGLTTRYEEREMERCVPMERIAAMQTGDGNRLLLFLADERIISVNLERMCRSREFYSGFYLEGNEDGQMCVGRDELHSRSGAKCEIERMREMVPVEE